MTKLTGKQRAWVEHYAATLNGTEAARLAGYKGGYGTLRYVGCTNLTKSNIKKELSKRFSKMAMDADECLARLADQARGDIGNAAEALRGGNSIAGVLLKAQELGVSHLIKKVSETANGIAVEFYGAQKALELIGRVHGLFTDKIEHSGSINMQELPNDELRKLAGR